MAGLITFAFPMHVQHGSWAAGQAGREPTDLSFRREKSLNQARADANMRYVKSRGLKRKGGGADFGARSRAQPALTALVPRCLHPAVRKSRFLALTLRGEREGHERSENAVTKRNKAWSEWCSLLSPVHLTVDWSCSRRVLLYSSATMLSVEQTSSRCDASQVSASELD